MTSSGVDANEACSSLPVSPSSFRNVDTLVAHMHGDAGSKRRGQRTVTSPRHEPRRALWGRWRGGRRWVIRRERGRAPPRPAPLRRLACRRASSLWSGPLSLLTGDAASAHKSANSAGGAAGLQPPDVGPPRGKFLQRCGQTGSLQTSPERNRLLHTGTRTAL